MNLHGYSQDTEWSELTVDKGYVQFGATISHSFVRKGIKEIKTVKPMCNCIKSSIKDNVYTFSFKVKSKTKKNIRKMIEVKYTDGTREYLIIKATLNETK